MKLRCINVLLDIGVSIIVVSVFFINKISLVRICFLFVIYFVIKGVVGVRLIVFGVLIVFIFIGGVKFFYFVYII